MEFLRGREEQAGLAKSEHHGLEIDVPQMSRTGVESKSRIALRDGPKSVINKKPRQLRRPHLLEFVFELAQQVFRDQLHQHGVVALKRSVDVRVSLQGTEPVYRQVPFSTAGFAAGLDSLSSVPSGNRFQSGGQSFQRTRIA